MLAKRARDRERKERALLAAPRLPYLALLADCNVSAVLAGPAADGTLPSALLVKQLGAAANVKVPATSLY